MLLAGDVGGTKTNLAIFASLSDLRAPLAETTLPSADFPSLEALVQKFMSQTTFSVERACFGVAGPVMGGKAKVTNLSWTMDERQLQRALGIERVHLLNDLDAMARAVPHLGPEDLHTLNSGSPQANAPLAVIAPGTGLGEGFLSWDGDHYRTHPSEGGHADFAPINDAQIGLLRYLLDRIEHVSYEHLCSGVGIPHIYGYLKSIATVEEPAWVAEQMAATDKLTPIIISAALASEAPSQICIDTLKTFAAILGAEAGNLVLKVLATGGVYIGGGIPPRVLSFLQGDEFMHAFRNKGRFSEMLARVPVHVILNGRVGLLGAAYHGFEM